MVRHKVEISGVSTSNIKVLTSEENINLFKKLKETGDKKTRDKLIKGNLNLVFSRVIKFNNCIDNMDDLFQIGCIGLMKAVDEFDLSRNVRFSTYAVFMINNEIRHYFRDEYTLLNIPRPISELANKIKRFNIDIYEGENKLNIIKEISNELNVSPKKIILALNSLKKTLNIDEMLSDENLINYNLLSIVSDLKENEDKWVNRLAIKEWLKTLSKDDRNLIYQLYCKEKTQKEIAEKLNLSEIKIFRKKQKLLKTAKRYVK